MTFLQVVKSENVKFCLVKNNDSVLNCLATLLLSKPQNSMDAKIKADSFKSTLTPSFKSLVAIACLL